MLALLSEDLAHLDPDMLGRAIDRHVATSPYMPKAADLIKLAQSMTAPATSLDDYAAELNEKQFTKTNGWHWYVRTHPDGKRELDRNDGEGAPVVRWQPKPGEAKATQEVIAILIAQGAEQELFSQMVRRGDISRMVDERLAS